ncbi:MAG TPA: hypothetical protein VGE74_25765 [Gemmata sp.]
MRARYAPLLAVALALFPAWVCAAPPVDVPAEVKGDVGAFVTVRGKTDGAVVRFHPLDAGLNVFPSDLLTDRKATVVSAAKPGRYRLLAYSSVKDDPTEPAIVTVVIGGAPAPGPTPPGPQPEPSPPDALKSFRAVLVIETGATLTKEQFATVYAKSVADWLGANCTNGEWRRYDRDARADADTAALNALWAAAKPQLKSVPCVAVERNGAVRVIPIEGTPEALIQALTKLREGK